MKDVYIYIIICLICQSKVIHCHWSYDQLKSLSILKNMWNLLFKEINLNWITELSSSMKIKNSQKYNSILIIMCCITKYTLFIFTQNNFIAADFTEFFFEHVECYFDFLKNIITDKNSHITLNFWQEICEIKMIKQWLFTAYYLQIDD